MNRSYLFSGWVSSPFGAPVPFNQIIDLAPDEVLDVVKLHEIQGICETEIGSAWREQLPSEWRLIISGFSALPGPNPMPVLTLHLNPADSGAMPPVGSPLIIEIQPGVLIKATRLKHAEQKDAELRYDLEGGGYVVGRFPWTHQ